MTLPDPIERGEAMFEHWEKLHRVGGNIYRCMCGCEFELGDGQTLSADPYATPVCPACFDQWQQHYNDEMNRTHG